MIYLPLLLIAPISAYVNVPAAWIGFAGLYIVWAARCLREGRRP
jgi:hypothetical protein